MNNVCNVKDCHNKPQAKGLCSVHYKIFLEKVKSVMNEFPLKAEIRHGSDEKCFVKECVRKSELKGMCLAHYQRWRRGMTVVGPIRPRRSKIEQFDNDITSH